MLIKNKQTSNKTQLALMAGLSLSTLTSTSLLNAVHANPQIIQELKKSPFAISNYVTIHASASVVSSVPANSYGVDVSDYQGNDMGPYARAGAKYVIIKVSEGYYPEAGGKNAGAKVQSALANNMMVMGYHFYHYNGSVADAQKQAQVAINAAKNAGVPLHSYLALDWESEAGRGENCGSTAENTQEALAWMRAVRQAGYLPMLYSGSAYLKAHFDRSAILKEFPGSFWVASYPYSTYNQPSYSAPMDKFPSMDGVAIWQFGNDIYGLHTDGNINVLPLEFLQPNNPSTPTQPTKTTTTVRFIDTNDNNKVVSTQQVTGDKGTEQNVNIPANYNSNITKVTNNGGTIDVKLTHKTQQVTKNVSYSLVTGAEWVNVPEELRLHHNLVGPASAKPISVQITGTKDLVTGQTQWNELSPRQALKDEINQSQNHLFHYQHLEIKDLQNNGLEIITVSDYNQLTPDEKSYMFPETNHSSDSASSSVPSSSAQSSSATSSTPSSSTQSSSASSSVPSSSAQSSSATSSTPSSSTQSSSASSSVPSSSAQSSSASSSVPSSSAQSSSASSSVPSSSAQSSSASSNVPSSSAQSSSASSNVPSSSAQSSSASSNVPSSSAQSSSASSNVPSSSAQSSSASSNVPSSSAQSSSAKNNTTNFPSKSSSITLTNKNLAQTNTTDNSNKDQTELSLVLLGASTLLVGTSLSRKKKN